MPENTFLLEVITPEKVLVSEEIESIELPGSQGELQVLAGHTPFLTDLKIGAITFINGTKKTTISISGGFCEVLQDKTNILAHTAEQATEIDMQRAEKSQKRAQKRMQDASADSSIDEERARLSLMRAINRLNVLNMK